MGYVLIRPDPAADMYVIWNSEWERPVGYGDRVEIAEDAEELEPDRGDIAARLDHTDLHGSSMVPYPWGWYAHHWFIYEQRGYLPREHLVRAAELLCDDRGAEVWDLLVPFEDATEVRRG